MVGRVRVTVVMEGPAEELCRDNGFPDTPEDIAEFKRSAALEDVLIAEYKKEVLDEQAGES